MTASPDIVSIYAVFADEGEAERIGRLAVEQRLAACVNILGACQSIYRWKGRVETATEVVAIFKTDRAHADALIERIVELHSYEVPCVTARPIAAAACDYAEWIRSELSSGA